MVLPPELPAILCNPNAWPLSDLDNTWVRAVLQNAALHACTHQVGLQSDTHACADSQQSHGSILGGQLWPPALMC